MATADWSSLTCEILYLILGKMFDPIQQIRFAAVCKDWRRVSKTYNEITQRWRGPMLIIIPSHNANPQQEIGTRFVCNNIVELTLPCLNNNSTIKCFGSHRDNGGWLVIVDLIEGDHLNVTLVNPFRKQASPIRLPPLEFYQSTYENKGWYPKFLLFGDPTLNPDGFAVVAIYHPKMIGYKLPLIKGRRSEEWTYLDILGGGEVGDTIFYKSKVYVFGRCGKIVSMDIASSKQVMLFEPEATGRKVLEPNSLDKLYLVESTKGDLFHVRKVWNSNLGSHWKTTGFLVFKVVFNDRDGSILDLVEVDSIGDEAFFVGDNRSFSVLAPDFPNCQMNSIYFTDDFKTIVESENALLNMGIYKLDVKTIKLHSSVLKVLGVQNSIQQAIWTYPPFNGL